jgi:hypothetical protein
MGRHQLRKWQVKSQLLRLNETVYGEIGPSRRR